MRIPIKTGILFGIFNLITNISLAKYSPGMHLGIIFTLGLLAFNILFTLLFVKRAYGYQLSFINGVKSSIQCGIVQSFFYFLSVVLIQNYFVQGFFPELKEWQHYLLIFNVNTILFSLISIIFGAITSGFLYTKK